MSNNKDDGAAQDAAERIKAAALSAAKGLSRAQAERAAAAAARNVNAYGQKEEGPSRWQERKEAKRQMYLMSTEKQVRLGERKDPKSSTSTLGTASQCQKCFQTGHWTYECKNERVEEKSKKSEKKKSKRKHKSDTESGNDSEASVFESDSDASSVTASDESSGENTVPHLNPLSRTLIRTLILMIRAVGEKARAGSMARSTEAGVEADHSMGEEDVYWIVIACSLFNFVTSMFINVSDMHYLKSMALFVNCPILGFTAIQGFYPCGCNRKT
ncbi:hypothetical protein DH2020_020093 [Rehmannia glutinosa]|uniref:Zinc finger protein n=1 Tax=Rehmannia glutinosa TaxID=99300 RepID=A0ABR0WJE2_REHGL